MSIGKTGISQSDFERLFGEITFDRGNPEIVGNRAEFVRLFGIRSCKAGKPAGNFVEIMERYYNCDHPESYKSQNDRIVIIFSNYVCNGADTDLTTIFGFARWKPLYNTGAVTYTRVFESAIEMRSILKDVFGKNMGRRIKR